MKFGPVAPEDSIGGVTVHAIRQGPLVLKKGTVIGATEVTALKQAGVKEIVVARLDKDDVSEDEAAASIAAAVAGEGVNVERAFTGRANLFAAKAGVLVVDRDAVDRINRVDEAITFATLSAFKPVVAGEMIATVKIIPFGVEAKLRDAAVVAAQAGQMRVAPFTIQQIYFREGETVPAQKPVVSILPPGNMKVRFFVPEPELPKLKVGEDVRVTCDGCASDLTAKIYFIATMAEYTPPVIYSLDERSKLVYLIQARPNKPDSLRVGQPVSIFTNGKTP